MSDTPSLPALALKGTQRVRRNDPPPLVFSSLRIRALETLQVETKCLSIVAPVGYGKTVLMSMVLYDFRQAGRQCFWLSLDDRDLTVDGIVSVLGGMLHGDEPSLYPADALFRSLDLPERRIDTLIHQLNNHPRPLTIFIDNLHVCSDPGLRGLLDQLLFNTRETLHLVVSSSREIPFDTARAQLQGLIRQVGVAELSFSEEEIAGLLGERICQAIGEAGVAEVARKTEGWPAAARMIKILLDGSQQPREALASFSGAEESLTQLLKRQALSVFTAETSDFLLCLAQLRTFSEALCTEAIGSLSVREHLHYLTEHNVFIIPLDYNRTWFRLHGLFREHLRHESEVRLSLSRRQEILTRAARWCQAQGLWREAVEYAFASGSIENVVHILDHIAPFFVRNHGGIQYMGWVERLHDAGKQASAEAEYWFVWALAFRRRYEYAHKQITKLSARLQRRKPRAGTDDLLRRIANLRISIDYWLDRLDDASQGAQHWLAGARGGEDDAFNLTAAHCIICCHLVNSLHLVEARQAAQSAREMAFQAESVHAEGWAACFEALTVIAEGDYASAYSGLVRMIARISGELGEDAGLRGTAALMAARCAVAMGQDAEARQLLALGIDSLRSHGFLDAAACGLEAALMLWGGEDDDVVSMSVLRDVVAAYPQRLSLTFSCYLIRRLIVLGRLDEAVAEAQRIGFGLASRQRRNRIENTHRVARLYALIAMTKIELEIAAGRYKQAIPMMSREISLAKSSGCHASLVELELNSALVAVRHQDSTLGVRHMTRAVRIAASRRIARPFMDRIDVLRTLVSQSKPSVWGFATEEESRFFAQICRQLEMSDQVSVASLIAADNAPRAVDVLTPREVELLGFIEAGLSNQHMADRIDVSVTTIKWHLQNLYGKLGVSSRTAALARARSIHLRA